MLFIIAYFQQSPLLYFPMSWYMSREVPTFQHRGIKVDGYKYMQAPHLNLSWGMDSRQAGVRQHQNGRNAAKESITKDYNLKGSNLNVMTQASVEEQQLMKLIKSRKGDQKANQSLRGYNNRTKSRSKSSQHIQNSSNHNNQSKQIKNSQFSKRVRYLQNSLLPHCRQDNMDTVLDHHLTKQVSLEESKVRQHQQSPSRKAALQLGDGYDPFHPHRQVNKDLTQRLKEMYEYEERYKQRIDKNHMRLG